MQIKGKLSIKRRRDQKYLILVSKRERIRLGEKKRERKKGKEEEEEKRREEEEKRRRRSKKVWNSKVLYGFPWNCMNNTLSPNLGFC